MPNNVCNAKMSSAMPKRHLRCQDAICDAKMSSTIRRCYLLCQNVICDAPKNHFLHCKKCYLRCQTVIHDASARAAVLYLRCLWRLFVFFVLAVCGGCPIFDCKRGLYGVLAGKRDYYLFSQISRLELFASGHRVRGKELGNALRSFRRTPSPHPLARRWR